MLTTWNALPLLDRLFDAEVYGDGSTGFTPHADVMTNENELVVVCDVPGVKPDDLELTIERSTLTLKGARRYDGGERDKVWLGRGYGAFQRAFTLPDDVDAENLSAHLADGVLTIHIAKKPEAKPRRITIGGHATKELEEKA